MFEPAVTVPPHLEGRSGRWFLFDPRKQLLLTDGDLPTAAEVPAGVIDVHVLGIDPHGPVWTGRTGPDFEPPEDGHFADLRQAYAVLPEEDWILAGRAAQVLTWHDDHQFCSRCGSPTEVQDSERARTCPACRLMAFPRLTPAVIMLVERDDGRALLAWGRQFPGRFFSALAGFVEPGETLEQCVAREVREEAGIEVGNVRYFGSQPWPFPHSLMVGFNADYAGGELLIQESEIVEADWYSHDQLPPVPKGRMSIAGWLIEDWMTRMSAR
ncbi:MAG: NAD(+) diphosphatase [Acidimicrobiales bacterium]